MKYSVGLLTLTFSMAASAQSLQPIIRYATAHHHVVITAQVTLANDTLQLKNTWSQFLPKLDAFASLGHESTQTNARVLLKPTSPVILQPNDYGLTLNLNVFNGFANLHQLQANHATQKADQFAVQLAKDKVTFQILKDSIDVIRAREQVQQALSHIQLTQKTKHVIAQRLQASINTRSDLALADSQVLISKVALSTAQDNAITAETVFLHDAMVAAPDHITLPIVSPNTLPQRYEDFLAETLNNQPELNAIRWQHQAAIKIQNSSNSAFLPHVDVYAVAEESNKASGVDQKKHHYQIEATASWQLFNGFSDRYRQHALALKVTSSQSNMQALTAKLRMQCRTTWQAYLTYRKQAQQLNLITQQLHQVMLDYQKQFSVGRKDIIQLINAEKDYIAAKNNALKEKHQYQLSTYKILMLTGRIQQIFNDRKTTHAI